MNIVNNIDFLGSLLKSKLLKKNIPLTVIFNVTDRCNLQCRYCYAEYYRRNNRDLDLKEIFSIVDQLAEMGNKRISLCGGEPLIRDDIGRIIDYIKGKGIICTVNTNGSLVPKRIEELKSIDYLCISFDGDEEAHEINRGKDSFKKVMEAIDCATKNNIPIVTNTVLNKSNLHTIDFVLDTARKYKFAAEFNLLTDYIYENSLRGLQHKPTDEEYKEAIKKIIDYKKRRYPVLFSQKTYEHALNWPTYEWEYVFDHEHPELQSVQCSAGRFFGFIDTDGEVYPCPQLMRSRFANCLEMGLKRAFEKAGQHHCKACYMVDQTELNLLFQLDLGIIFNYFKKAVRFFR